ncbi:hypothetical protein BOTBODRAFT_44966 [Botryobasidium botryosum FD-172 SS1]|uniref:F-box domain-containing protein n=1 Tax=Botryobasidium botryosum (strain FD-172 SS1) TaxID=930990 RepID=A0A067MPF3_BOTB1|nr:hypothetical protein BOTBODRAFT_44966 [Botryobasidium botryosum FD-172 SS1]
MADLGSKRNSLAPISCLPDEVLSLIFEAACTDRGSCQSAPLNVAAVSRAWRDIALRTPRIWNAITISSASLFLPRSKGCPLDIEVNVGCHSATERYFALCIPHSDRWRSLNIRTWQGDVLTMFLSARMPRLQSLVASWGGRNARRPPAEAESFGPQLSIAQASHSQLLTLDLDSLYLPLNSFNFSRLVKLRLASTHSTSADITPTRELLHTLNACPNLEVLYLDKIYLSTESESHLHQYARAPIHLPLLREASFHFLSPHTFKAVLTSIQFTTSVSMSISTNTDPTVDTDWRNVFPVVPNLSLIHELKIFLSDDIWDVTGCDFGGKSLLTITCVLKGRRGTSNLTHIVSSLIAFVQHHPMPHVIDLRIAGSRDHSSAAALHDFHSLFAGFPLLTSLTIDYWSALVDAIILAPGEVIFPRLRRLCLRWNTIVHNRLVELVRARNRPSGASVSDSANGGVPLQRLTLVECKDISDSLASELREMAPEIKYRIFAPDSSSADSDDASTEGDFEMDFNPL